MKINELPTFDASINTTGCCPAFNPQGWDDQQLHFKAKPFVLAGTQSLLYMPLNMGRVFSRVQAHIASAGAADPGQQLVLSRDLSPWRAEHLFAVTGPVPGEQMTTLSGDFLTKVYEGPYSKVSRWYRDMTAIVRARGGVPKSIRFFYTTCPKCAKVYGKNFVVGVAEL